MSTRTTSDTEAGASASRHLPLAGTFNVRDVGGYATVTGGQTRWGMLFRADSLHALTPEAQTALLDLGLRTVIDLRHPRETEQWPNVFAESPRVRYVSVPLNIALPAPDLAARQATDMAARYRLYLDQAQAELAIVLRTLAQCERPALVHCQAGKDRTGLVVALVLAAAGVPHATIADDYALTASYMTDAYYDRAREQAGRLGIPWERYEQALVCHPELMLATLAYLDERYGGVERYLELIGLSGSEIAALRDALAG